LNEFGLDFALTGPPAVFFSPGETPGWSPDLQSAISGFVFGYAATLAKPRHSDGAKDRAVQVCAHHGYPSDGDAEVAWFSLTAALATGGDAGKGATIHTFDVAEVFTVSGNRAVLASVGADRFGAVVLASRAGADLITVAIADFSGKTPSIEEALDLAEVEAEKIARSAHEDGSNLSSAFARQWTPGFTFGGAGAPFFAWPVVLGGQPVPTIGESSETLAMRREAAGGVQFQSHVEGPFYEATQSVAGHGLYYSGQSNFFASTGESKTYHEETAARLRAGLPGIKAKTVRSSNRERLHAYKVPSSFGTLAGIMLHRRVFDANFPLSFALHVVAVPLGGGAPSLDLDQLAERLEGLLEGMGDGLESCLIEPRRAPLLVPVDPVA
jgi:hypothetical protein